MNKKEIETRLKLLDEEASLAFGEDEDAEIYIVGGGAFVLMNYITRATVDIDVLDVKPRRLRELMEKYDLNTGVFAYEMCFPEGYKQRAVRILPKSKKIKYYVLSMEDLVISKLCSTGREKDSLDIRSPFITQNIDWAVLQHEYEEITKTMGYLAKSTIEANYNAFIKDAKP